MLKWENHFDESERDYFVSSFTGELKQLRDQIKTLVEFKDQLQELKLILDIGKRLNLEFNADQYQFLEMDMRDVEQLLEDSNVKQLLQLSSELKLLANRELRKRERQARMEVLRKEDELHKRSGV